MLSATPKRLFKLERREDLLGPKSDALIAEERPQSLTGRFKRMRVTGCDAIPYFIRN